MGDVDSRGPEAQYFAHLREGRFMLQHCNACNRTVHYPRVACTTCGSAALDWIAARGTGTVYAVTTVRLDPKQPYNVSIVELDEGVRTMGTVSGPPDAVKIGQRVTSRIENPAQSSARVVFDPAGGAP